MSKTLLEILLSEIGTIRVACRGQRGNKNCGAVIEIPVERLKDFFVGGQATCPFCSTEFYASTPEGHRCNPFLKLGEALQLMCSIEGHADVSIVVPASEKDHR